MSDYAHRETDVILQAMQDRMREEYRQATQEVQQKLTDYLQAFKRKDAKMKADVGSGRITQKQYINWRKNQMLTGKRWLQMLDTLTEDYVNSDKIAVSIIKGYMPDVYALNHNYGTFEVEKGVNIDTSYTLYDRHTVEELMREDKILLPAPTIPIEKNLEWNRRHIQSAIFQGVVQGDSINQIAQRFTAVTDMNFNQAVRNARTACTGAENLGRNTAFKRAESMGIKIKRQWIATLDGRTRHSHRELDGQVRGLDEPFEIDGKEIMLPGDPNCEYPEEIYNCRCNVISVFPKHPIDVENLELRNTRRMFGKDYSKISYDEWKKDKMKPKHYEESVYEYEERVYGKHPNSRP